MLRLHIVFMRAAALACTVVALGLAPAHADQRQHAGPPRMSNHLPPAPPAARPGQWFDGAHGHRHYYPVSGWRVHATPPHTHWVGWGGARYGYYNGVWYAPYGGAYVVARPPVGIVINGLPVYATAVTLGGMGYLYANGVYYRDHGDGSYEVVPSPVVVSTANDGGGARSFVYPKLGQSAETQASDEYECHRWAVNQTGFDPSAAAAGERAGPAPRSDYARAQFACLEGRGYTVR